MEKGILLSGLRTLLEYVKENAKRLANIGELYGTGICAVSKYIAIKQKLSYDEYNEVMRFIKISLFKCKSVEPREIHCFNVRNNRIFCEEAGMWLFLPRDWKSRINWLEEQINKLETNK